MAAMRSLITLIARRTTGVSANRRRFIGVGLGRSRPGNCTGLRIAGSASVFRSASASRRARRYRRPSGRPRVACRQISRNCSPTFTRTFLFLPPKNKKGTARRDHASSSPVVSEQLSVVSFQSSVDNSPRTLCTSNRSFLNKIDPTTNSGNYMQTTSITHS